MSARIPDADLEQMLDEPGSHRYTIALLVHEIRRLRGIILSSAREIDGHNGDMALYFDILMEEARAHRLEIAGGSPGEPHSPVAPDGQERT